MENSLREIAEMEEGELKTNLMIHTANQLKIKYITWNRDIISDEQIAAHILHMTNGKLLLPTNIELIQANDVLKQLKLEDADLEAKAALKKRKPVKKSTPMARKKTFRR
jgi:hypothetical protein